MSTTDAEKAELEEYRRQDLLQRMREVSREHWAAGWHSGLEHDLYLMTFHGASPDYGMGTITSTTLAAIKRLAVLSRIWWVKGEASGSLLAIALEEAEQRFSRLVAEDASGAVQSLSIPEIKQVYERATPDAWSAETIAPVWSGMPVWHVYRLRENPVIALFHREEKGDWELRFGDTTVDIVEPAWAKKC
jgi:hypothetical protein